MLSIAICEDEALIRTIVAEQCERYLKNAGVEAETTEFENGEKLLACDRRFDLLFLDIEMPGMNGLDTAEKIRERDEDVRIIFLTSHAELMQRAFEVKAFRYLIKPLDESELSKSLADAVREKAAVKKQIVDDRGREVAVAERQILYIESIGDATVVYTEKQGALISRHTLRHWEELLPGNEFVKIHRAFIVSLGHVESADKAAVKMNSGSEIPLAKRKAAAFKATWINYIRNTAR